MEAVGLAWSSTSARKRLHRCLGYAVRKKRLTNNPLSKANLPEGWPGGGKHLRVADGGAP
jgi:hypothetical protein